MCSVKGRRPLGAFVKMNSCHWGALRDSELVREKRTNTIKISYHLVVLESTTGPDHGLDGAYSASRLNMSMATSVLIDSWEINSAAP